MQAKQFSFIISSIITLIVSCGVSACVENNIMVKPLAYKIKPVIECMITPGKKPRLYLNSKVAYFDKKIDNKDLNIKNAIVTIDCPFGTDILKEDSVFNQFSCQYDYFYQGDNPIEKNVTYNLTVKTMGGVCANNY